MMKAASLLLIIHTILLYNLTFYEVVEVAVVGAVVSNGIPGLRDGHGLQTERQLYVLYKRKACTKSDRTVTGI